MRLLIGLGLYASIDKDAEMIYCDCERDLRLWERFEIVRGLSFWASFLKQ